MEGEIEGLLDGLIEVEGLTEGEIEVLKDGLKD
jgi:hypothetical protein